MIRLNSMKQLVRQLKALSNERRVKIIVMLARCNSMTVGEIADGLNLSIKSTSHHLQNLKKADFVDFEQTGTSVHYRLNKNHSLIKLLGDRVR